MEDMNYNEIDDDKEGLPPLTEEELDIFGKLLNEFRDIYLNEEHLELYHYWAREYARIKFGITIVQR